MSPVLLLILGAANLVASFPDSGKWVYTNISMTEKFIGENLFFIGLEIQKIRFCSTLLLVSVHLSNDKVSG